MRNIEKFLKQYGYKRNFTETMQEHLGEIAKTEANQPESTDCDDVPISTGESNSNNIAISDDANSSGNINVTDAYRSPVITCGDKNSEDEGDISTVQKEPRDSTATPSADTLCSQPDDHQSHIIGSKQSCDTGIEQRPSSCSIAFSTPAITSKTSKGSTIDKSAVAVQEHKEQLKGMTIGFKDEPEASRTPNFEDCGFSAMTLAMIKDTDVDGQKGLPLPHK